jgi:hypothetical protein
LAGFFVRTLQSEPTSPTYRRGAAVLASLGLAVAAQVALPSAAHANFGGPSQSSSGSSGKNGTSTTASKLKRGGSKLMKGGSWAKNHTLWNPRLPGGEPDFDGPSKAKLDGFAATGAQSGKVIGYSRPTGKVVELPVRNSGGQLVVEWPPGTYYANQTNQTLTAPVHRGSGTFPGSQMLNGWRIAPTSTASGAAASPAGGSRPATTPVPLATGG